jgi:hypothetical protein
MMTTEVSHQEVAYAYRVGEEVVLRMAGVRAYDVGRGRPVAAGCVPEWTIGDIVARRARVGAAAYAVRVRIHGAACLCMVDESAIEGVA